MRPFLRWAGGKRWLVATGRLTLPESGRFVEPFLGGGAVFFARCPDSALLSDLNPFLINAYVWMKAAPDRIFDTVIGHFNDHSSAHYYSVRKTLGRETIEDAAAFLYLNRSCFNGLFRVNLQGQFNVPIGTKVYELRERDEFLRWSKALASATIRHADFEQVISECGEGDFLFVDPPYTVNHNANGFIEYNEQIFSWDDQERLANSLSAAKDRGASFLLTNADHESIRNLYSEGYTLLDQERGSEMAGRTAHRGRTTELLIASSPAIVQRELELAI